jgi:hypothetical protein
MLLYCLLHNAIALRASTMPQRPDCGIDSPAMIGAELLLGGIAFAAAMVLFALRFPHFLGIPLWLVSLVVAL